VSSLNLNQGYLPRIDFADLIRAILYLYASADLADVHPRHPWSSPLP
jgi:hypothetical protein